MAEPEASPEERHSMSGPQGWRKVASPFKLMLRQGTQRVLERTGRISRASQVVTEIEEDEEAPEFELQGRQSMYEPEVVIERMALRRTPQVVEVLQIWWLTAQHSQQRDLGHTGEELWYLEKSQYVRVITKLYRAMVKEWNEEDALEVAEDAWRKDAEDGRMAREMYMDAIFEIADMYTLGVNEEEYAEFLWKLFWTVADGSRDKPDDCVWKEDTVIQIIKLKSGVKKKKGKKFRIFDKMADYSGIMSRLFNPTAASQATRASRADADGKTTEQIELKRAATSGFLRRGSAATPAVSEPTKGPRKGSVAGRKGSVAGRKGSVAGKTKHSKGGRAKRSASVPDMSSNLPCAPEIQPSLAVGLLRASQCEQPADAQMHEVFRSSLRKMSTSPGDVNLETIRQLQQEVGGAEDEEDPQTPRRGRIRIMGFTVFVGMRTKKSASSTYAASPATTTGAQLMRGTVRGTLMIATLGLSELSTSSKKVHAASPERAEAA